MVHSGQPVPPAPRMRDISLALNILAEAVPASVRTALRIAIVPTKQAVTASRRQIMRFMAIFLSKRGVFTRRPCAVPIASIVLRYRLDGSILEDQHNWSRGNPRLTAGHARGAGAGGHDVSCRM